MTYRHTATPAFCLLLGTLFATAPLQAQDSAFLACAQHSDRGQRIACLEDALEAAQTTDTPQPATSQNTRSVPSPPSTENQPAPGTIATPPAVDHVTTRSPEPEPATAAESVTAPATAVSEANEQTTNTERLRNFGREDSVRVSSDENGQDTLHDTITALEQRRGLWIVTLSSGQIWMQEVARRLNLRKGDNITIYRAGFGNGYRLSADRLNSFIRVRRVE